MALPACRRCGKRDPQKMFGLMTHWFGPFVELRPDHGYFYLCPACYTEHVQPHLEAVQGRLAELHPAAGRSLAEESSEGEPGGAESASAADRALAADEAARRSMHRKAADGG